jgi:glucose-6-phosphate 1-dehydrogenase
MTSRTISVQPFDLVVFGATGDLARRKLLPGLYRRLRAGQMPLNARIIGAARSDLSQETFRVLARDALTDFVASGEIERPLVDQFLACLDYVRIDAASDSGWGDLAALLGAPSDRVRAMYLSVAPGIFSDICDRLASSGIATPDTRIVIEKPLGRDLASARALNAQLSRNFKEDQLYRIDHYLGKETVQNLMAIRFANALFEPLWNARHIDHVQITVAEDVGVEGRAAYYDQSGAMRDMVQNHLMQLLCLTAMEPPSHFNPTEVRDEKLKVIRALEPIGADRVALDTARGQYRPGSDGDGYIEDTGNPASRTESFAALKVRISNWRWAGTPFYLRTGKRLRARMSEIAVIFKRTPHLIFPASAGDQHGNSLVIRLQPDEGITLSMTVKEPGPGGMRLTQVPLDMTFAETLTGDDLTMPDAYERLVMDVIRGDQTLFMRSDEVEAAWAWTDQILRGWEASGNKPSEYDAGGSGPDDALLLMHRDGRRWREIAD